MGSKYEYLNTKIHIDKIVKGEGGYLKSLRFLELSPFFFRILFCRVLFFVGYFEYFFLGFHKGTVLYYQMSHYGFRLGAWWRSEIDRVGGGEGRFGVGGEQHHPKSTK